MQPVPPARRQLRAGGVGSGSAPGSAPDSAQRSRIPPAPPLPRPGAGPAGPSAAWPCPAPPLLRLLGVADMAELEVGQHCGVPECRQLGKGERGGSRRRRGWWPGGGAGVARGAPSLGGSYVLLQPCTVQCQRLSPRLCAWVVNSPLALPHTCLPSLISESVTGNVTSQKEAAEPPVPKAF